VNKILLISNRSPSTGIGTYSHQLVKHLKETWHVDLDFLNLTTLAEDSYGNIVSMSSQKIKRLVDHLLFLQKIPKDYKVYHILNPNLGILIMKCHPAVVTVHDVFPFTPIATHDLITQSLGLDSPILLAMKFNIKFVKTADRIISVSKHTKKDLISLFRIKASKIHVIYPGIDRNVFHVRDKRKARQNLNLPQKSKIILHIGVDEPRKNIKTLIEAFYKVKKRVPEALLVRIGGMRSATKKLIASLHLNDSIVHHKKVPSTHLFYNAADVLAFPSYYEGFGLPVLEAMASGLPVVAGDSTSIPEIVGKAGMLFPPFNATILSELICKVINDKKTQQEMTIGGLERSSNFDWNLCAKQTLEIYKSLSF
jgi:glycosyltransferase involved in cell wall biosynthesis